MIKKLSDSKLKFSFSILCVLLIFAFCFTFMSVFADARANYTVKFLSDGYTNDAKFAGYRSAFVVDTSVNNGTVDWNKVYNAGIDYAMIRIGYRGYTEGELYQDTKFEENYTNAKAAGLKVGVYFYSQAVTIGEAGEEAETVLRILNNRQLDLPVAFDVEYAQKNSKFVGRLYEHKLLPVIQTLIANHFCTSIKTGGYEPMVYANYSMLKEHMSANLLNSPVWLARYSKSADYDGDYTMWQFTCTERIDGVNGNCDVSVIYIPDSTTPSTTAPAVPFTLPGIVTPTTQPAQTASELTTASATSSSFAEVIKVITQAFTTAVQLLMKIFVYISQLF
ncbi:MAG: glycoside hydrolase family 25 protein [Clostridiales bacterium]|nr:glycoside hydrolase family 25 protein [Clostridiales bacterium]